MYILIEHIQKVGVISEATYSRLIMTYVYMYVPVTLRNVNLLRLKKYMGRESALALERTYQPAPRANDQSASSARWLCLAETGSIF